MTPTRTVPKELWVLDATLADETNDATGAYPFCPLAGDEFSEVLVGLTLITDRPPGRFAGVYHADGMDACQRWSEAHRAMLDNLAG
jgi:hypothetical protein